MTDSRDKDLLFGVMSVQLGLTSESDVMGCAETWLRDPSQTLADHLEHEGVIGPEQRKMIEAMVERAISVNEGDADKTFNALGQAKALADRLVRPPDSRERELLDSDEELDGISFEHAGRYRDGDPHGTVAERKRSSDGAMVTRSREIGRGGIGRVLIAYDAHLGREIAVKELLPHLVKSESSGRSTDTRAILGRFLREARVTAQLEHPNIVPVYELGKRRDGTLYYTMKLVRGRTLSAALKSANDLSDRLKLLNHFVDMCQALAYAHSRGVVHRDIKPQNVMLGEFGETLVLDWGLAKIRGKRDLRGQDLLREVKQLHEAEAVATIPGSAFGTPAYMSPEQAEGQIDEIDERSDVWGLGVVLFEILTGRLPFQGPNPLAVVVQVMKEQPSPVLSVCPEAPVELAAVADRALRRDKNERYQTAKELADEIVAFQTGGRVEAHTYTPWELLKRFIEEQKSKLAIAGVAFVCLLAVAFGAYVEVINERDRAVRAEADSKKNLAEALTERARGSIRSRDFMSAELYAGEALTYGERPEARGVVVAIASEWRPKLIWETVTWSPCQRVAVSPDGAMIACATTDEVALFMKKSGAEAGRHLKAPGGFALAAVFDPAGKYLAAGGEDGRVRVFDLSSDSVARELTIGKTVRALAYSPDGRSLAVGGDERTISVFDTSSWEIRLRLSIEGGEPIAALAFSPDGRWLASGGKGDLVRLFDPVNGDSRGGFRAHEKDVTSLAFSPDTKTLVSASRDRTARAFDLLAVRETGIYAGHDDEVRAVEFSADGRFVFTGSADKIVRVWGRSSFRTIARIDGDDPIASIAASKDGSTVVIAGDGRTLRVFDVADAAPPPAVRTQRSPVSAVSIAPSGELIATGAADGVIRVYEANTNKKARLFTGHTAALWDVAFSPDGTLLASGGADRKVRVWLVREGRELGMFDVPAEIAALGFFSTHGNSVVAALENGVLRFYGDEDKRDVQVGAGLVAMANRPDCPILAVATDAKAVVLVAVAPRSIAAELPVQGDRINALALSPKCDVVAVAAGENVALYQLEGKKLLGRLPQLDGPVNAVAFSPDGARIAWAGKDKLVHIASVADRIEIARMDAHAAEINALDWSKTSDMLASGSEDKTLRLWNLSTLDVPGADLLSRARKDFGMRLVAGKIAFERRGRRE